jgi:hypothetical protein
MHLRLTSFIALLLLAPWVRAQDEKVFKLLSADQAESILRDLKIDFKKMVAGRPAVTFYDLRRQNTSVRLYLYDGKDIMLDAIFAALPLEKINDWNVRAKFSRACLHKDDKGGFTALESNLDIVGGVTTGAVRQFIVGFDEEIRSFRDFIGAAPTPPAVAAVDEPIYTKASNDKIEAILGSLNIKFKKIEQKNSPVVAYDYVSNNHTLRLTNFGGADLMIDAHFKKLPLQTVNDYNLKRKFIRAVAYNVMGKEYTSLESNLDCLGGVSDSIVRHFIRAFDEEVQEFARFVQGK